LQKCGRRLRQLGPRGRMGFSWIMPGTLMLSAIPAFVVGMWFVRALGRHGVNEVLTFMALMPVLVAAWYYAVGWVIDRWTDKRQQSA